MIAWNIDVLASVSSTQEIVMQAASDNAQEGYVIQALQQKSGKGRSGHQWHSPMGNLYMSVLLRPDCNMARAGELSFVIAVALSNALDLYIDPQHHTKQLKWPNDILVNGLKLSGILLEGAGDDAYSIGIGVNIFNAPELAVRLDAISNAPVYINKVRDNILDKIGIIYAQWQSEGFEPIRNAWLAQAYGINDPITARLPQEKKQGIFRGINNVGALLMEMPDGDIQEIHAADVHFGEGGHHASRG